MNGGFNGKIIYKWAMFHGYVSHNQMVPFIRQVRDRRTKPSWAIAPSSVTSLMSKAKSPRHRLSSLLEGD